VPPMVHLKTIPIRRSAQSLHRHAIPADCKMHKVHAPRDSESVADSVRLCIRTVCVGHCILFLLDGM
jgi:hypothetical protein